MPAYVNIPEDITAVQWTGTNLAQIQAEITADAFVRDGKLYYPRPHDPFSNESPNTGDYLLFPTGSPAEIRVMSTLSFNARYVLA